MNSFQIEGKLVSITERSTYPARISVEHGKIKQIERIASAPERFIMPGFVDAHVHIESSMVTPTAFSQAAAPFGTVATVSDPHEIANVCGVEGVLYMIENARLAAVKFHFGAPSCVPATSFETAGAVINAQDIEQLMGRPEIFYLAEMMNFPGVLARDAEVMAKIASARVHGKPTDGHAPGLMGADAAHYIATGISTDHECTSLEEALGKLQHGMKILIREGSAAKNFEALLPLFKTHPQMLMFCSDDKHPDALVKGHINELVQRAIAAGYDMYDILHAACMAPVAHYNLPVGQLRAGDDADFILVKDCKQFEVLQTYIRGVLVAENGSSKEKFSTPAIINNFQCEPISEEQVLLRVNTSAETLSVKVIEAKDGQLLTGTQTRTLKVVDGVLQADVVQDVLKIVVVNRYQPAEIAVGFITNFGLKSGALASSVAHDSHNIVAVGVDDTAIVAAVNAVVADRGGISVFDGSEVHVLGLPVAGLMTDRDVWQTAQAYELLDKKVKALGSNLQAPFMTLSFMALPVIPHLKMTDKGLFDVDSFNFTNVIIN